MSNPASRAAAPPRRQGGGAAQMLPREMRPGQVARDAPIPRAGGTRETEILACSLSGREPLNSRIATVNPLDSTQMRILGPDTCGKIIPESQECAWFGSYFSDRVWSPCLSGLLYFVEYRETPRTQIPEVRSENREPPTTLDRAAPIKHASLPIQTSPAPKPRSQTQSLSLALSPYIYIYMI